MLLKMHLKQFPTVRGVIGNMGLWCGGLHTGVETGYSRICFTLV